MKLGGAVGAKKDGDILRIDGGQNVWIDHNELFNKNVACRDAPGDDIDPPAGAPSDAKFGDLTFESLIDIKKDAKHVTVSYNIIRDSEKTGLDGSTVKSDGKADFGRDITYHHNIYRDVNARLPLQRGGEIHAYNKLYDNNTGTGINVRTFGTALIERNWFQYAKDPVTFRYDNDNCGKW